MDNDDLISRSAAVDQIGDMIKECRNEDDYNLADAMILVRRYIIKKLPAVDAAPIVHAHWVEEPDRVNHWHCSNCGLTVGMASLAYRYCYACGAKIDDKKKETIVNE